MKCIYCNSTENLTSSDIISYAITGAKLAKSFVCKTHNAFTNDQYEKKFISDMDFFRNHLGLTTRDGKLIQYKADISLDGMKIHGVKLSNRRSLYLPKEVVSGKSNEGKKVLMAPMDKLKKIGGDRVTSVDLSNVILHKTISANDFVGYYAIHSVAKMAYEWYCYINGIEEYKEVYKEIVNYILGNNKEEFVDIIADGNYYRAIDCLSEIGTHSFFQYDDSDGYRYVVFDLWNTISYRVKICKSPSNVTYNENSLLIDLYLYRLDGSKSKMVFGVLSLNDNRKFSFTTVKSKDITVQQWKPYVKRIEKIMTTMVLSINNIKKIIDSIVIQLNNYDAGKIDIAQLLEFEENNTINVLEIINLLYKNKEKYNETKSFNENLSLFLNATDGNITRSIEDKNALVAFFVEKDKEGTLSQYLKNGIDYFYYIYENEMKRNSTSNK